MTDIIASRKFEADNGKFVTIDIFAPYLDGQDYRCDYVINWPDYRKDRYAYGIDSVQALILALKKMGTDLYTSEKWMSGNLNWSLSGEVGNLGVPVPDTVKDITPGVPF